MRDSHISQTSNGSRSMSGDAQGENSLSRSRTTGSSEDNVSTSTGPARSITAKPKYALSVISKSFSWSKKKGEKKADPPQQIVRANLNFEYKFTTDGKGLILWDRNEGCIYTAKVPAKTPTNDPQWHWHRLEMENLLLACGSGGRVGALSKVDRQYSLKVWEVAGTEARAIPNIAQSGVISSMTVAQDGNYVAVGWHRTVRIFAVTPGPDLPPIKLSDKGDFRSQRINFSKDGKFLAIATRKQKCLIDIVLYNREEARSEWPVLSAGKEQLLPKHQELGLSSVFYDVSRGRVLLTDCTNEPYHIVHSNQKKGKYIFWDPRHGKTQSAVACTSDSQYVFLDGDGYLYKLNLNESRQTSPERLDTRLQLRGGPPTSSSKLVYCFRIGDSDMMFGSTDLKGGFKEWKFNRPDISVEK